MKNQYQLSCNIAQSLNLIGDRWTLLILHAIQVGNHTYKQLQEALIGIPTNLLSNRLKSLEEDGLIECVLYQDHPPRYEYRLRESGSDLSAVYIAIAQWGEKHLQEKCPKTVVHTTCHHTVTPVYYCEECDAYIEADQVEMKEI